VLLVLIALTGTHALGSAGDAPARALDRRN
jgi:hypothetical protein